MDVSCLSLISLSTEVSIVKGYTFLHHSSDCDETLCEVIFVNYKKVLRH